jgi:cytochrome c-type biogenesis protein
VRFGRFGLTAEREEYDEPRDGMLQAIGEALLLGIWTATLPCPMATNLAAIAFLGRRVRSPWQTLLAGLLYAVGGAATYIGLAALVLAGMRAPAIAAFLGDHTHQVLGPLLIVAGMVLLELVRLPGVGLGLGQRSQARVERLGTWAALPLGALLALCFCPVSAVWFFGSVVGLGARSDSRFIVPLFYGIGAAAPVVAFTLLLVLSAQLVGRAYNAMARVQWWVQRAAGLALVLIGIFLSLRYIFGVV